MSATHLYRTLHNQNTKVWHRPKLGLYDSRGGVFAMTLKIPLTKITGGELFFWKTSHSFHDFFWELTRCAGGTASLTPLNYESGNS